MSAILPEDGILNNAHRRFEDTLERVEARTGRKYVLIDTMDLHETPNPTLRDFENLKKILVSTNAHFHIGRIEDKLYMIGRDSESDISAWTQTHHSSQFFQIFKAEIRSFNKLYKNHEFKKGMDLMIGIIFGLKEFNHGFMDTEDDHIAQRILTNIAKGWTNIIALTTNTISINQNTKKLLYQVMDGIQDDLDHYNFNIGSYRPPPNTNYNRIRRNQDDDDDDDDVKEDEDDDIDPYFAQRNRNSNNHNNQNHNVSESRSRRRRLDNQDQEEDTNRRKRRRVNPDENEVELGHCPSLKYRSGLGHNQFNLQENKTIMRDRQLKLRRLFAGQYDAFEPKIPNGIDWKSMTVDELKKYVRKYKFAVRGTKKDLVFRLSNPKQYLLGLKKEYHKQWLLEKIKKGEDINEGDHVFRESKFIFDPLSCESGVIRHIDVAKYLLKELSTPF